MNWFGLFTMAFGVLIIAVVFAIEYGYEQAEKDMYMSKEWTMRNHPTNGDWE